ncbi:MAG: transketolase C-terminal domain-containing protein [Coriobacteriia bacterium]|nr:transketolase C-terminal domain-containing protein [Coriobacteriia bacterium]
MDIVYTGEQDSRAYKSVIGETVDEIIQSDEKTCWLDADLSNCSGTGGNYSKSDRYINCGIAEGNMAGIAAGLSASGMKPYMHSFAPFASRRCFDQVFLSAGYAKNPITVVATDPGITAAFNGGTHMPFEDVALYREIPDSIICDCTDVPMLQYFLKNAKDMPGVKYIRVGRKASYQVYADDSEFQVGRGNVLRDGDDVVIIASGIMVHEALQAANKLDMSVAVIDPFTIKPLDVDLIREYAKKCGHVVVAENHNRIGGLTSAVSEAIVGIPCKFGYVAIEDEYGEVGPLDYLRERYDLTDEHIVKVCESL